MIGKKEMEKLKKYVGREVSIEYVMYGAKTSEGGILKNMEEFVNVQTDGASIPFVGYGTAIQKIKNKEGETIYENPNISDIYDRRDDGCIDRMKERSFGEEITKKQRAKSDQYWKEWEDKKEKLNKEAQGKSESLIERGKKLVKPELEKEWIKYAETNTKDFYSAGVVEQYLKIAEALSNGKTPEEAEGKVHGDITGFQMGCVAQAVTYFHPRGEEYKQYWNEKWMGKEEAKKAKGVVNPAIITIGGK